MIGLACLLIGLGMTDFANAVVKLSQAQTKVMQVAGRLLDEAQVSYVFGGYQLGDAEDCQRCNQCLAKYQPSPRQRLQRCGVCQLCSLDCSHFTELVFRMAGFSYPYLNTENMLKLPAHELLKKHRLLDLQAQIEQVQPGDLLVYRGHVVIVEKLHMPVADLARWRGDVIHATGGKELRAPGQGIQRQRFVDLANFRGPLLRILRHVQLSGLSRTLKPH